MKQTQKTDLAPKTEAREPAIKLGNRGVKLIDFDSLWRFARCICQSGLAPKDFSSPAAVVVAIQMGAELGLPPLASLQNIAVINGRPTVWGDAQLAVCRGSGLFDESAFDEHFKGEGDAQTAVCTVRRLPDGKPITRTFGVTHAKKAKLWNRKGRNGQDTPWVTYADRMLQMRARAYALRDAFADVLRGFETAEVARDIIDVDSARAPAPPLPDHVVPFEPEDQVEPEPEAEDQFEPEPEDGWPKRTTR